MVFHQGLDAVGQLQMDVDLRIRPQELVHHRLQMLLAETQRRCDDQVALGLAVFAGHLLVGIAQRIDDAAAGLEVALAAFDQHNMPLYAVWQAYLRTYQPKTLVAWGRGGPFFGVPGAEAFRRDLRDARIELLDSGHFALEEDAARVADLILQTF